MTWNGLDGAITLPAANIAEPFINVNDNADVAVAALIEDGHNGEVVEITGPGLLTFSEIASEISHVVGREVRFIPITKESFNSAIINGGASKEISWLLDYLFKTVQDGRNEYLCDGAQRALGRVPCSNGCGNFHCLAIYPRTHANRRRLENCACCIAPGDCATASRNGVVSMTPI